MDQERLVSLSELQAAPGMALQMRKKITYTVQGNVHVTRWSMYHDKTQCDIVDRYSVHSFDECMRTKYACALVQVCKLVNKATFSLLNPPI